MFNRKKNIGLGVAIIVSLVIIFMGIIGIQINSDKITQNVYVNNTNNIIQLSIDEYENLVYLLEKIDIINASQLLLNYYMIHIMNAEKLNNIASGKITNQQIKTIDWVSNKPKTISNFRKEESTDIFDGLN